jgi:hypothetical protein
MLPLSATLMTFSAAEQGKTTGINNADMRVANNLTTGCLFEVSGEDTHFPENNRLIPATVHNF